MNEIQSLRKQLEAERRHVQAVARGCASAHRLAATSAELAALAALREASSAYLALVLGWFDSRDARLTALGTRLPNGGALGREALVEIRSDRSPTEAWGACAALVSGAWQSRRDAIGALCAANSRVTDWRTFAGIDADTIHQERALYARVRAALPAGLELE